MSSLSEPAEPDVRVSVHVQHVPSHSTPERQLFAYFITIENQSDETWQVLTRHWDILSGDGQSFTVEGEGVVGEQPILAPGAQYTYNSFVTVDALPGLMRGHYGLQNAWGMPGRAEVPPFRLDVGERVMN